MSFDAKKIYELLPAIYRIRDAQQGEPLKELLAVMADQFAVLQEDLAQLYYDQFIETSAEWVVPYIGDLIGYRALHNVVPKIGSQRAEVAHTIGFRRRKGTAAMLEQLARDVTGWNARVVEFFERLGWTQWTPNHIRPDCFYAPDLRQWEPLENINGAFDSVQHTVDVRRVATGRGKYNLPNIGIFLWRLGAYSLTRTPLTSVQVPSALADQRHFHFHPLGFDIPLFSLPETEIEVTHLAEPLNVPMPISRRMFMGDKDASMANQFCPSADYYGAGKSILLETYLGGLFQEITAGEIIVADLSDTKDKNGKVTGWAHETFAKKTKKYLLDPQLGRVILPAPSKQPIFATFQYGFSDNLGGGEYDRLATFDALLTQVEKVPAPHATIQNALKAVSADGVVEISDSGRYKETLAIKVNAGQRIEVRAANEHRPTVVLGGDLGISLEAGSEVTLNGLLVSGGTIRVTVMTDKKDAVQTFRLRHCTLVPSANPSLIVDSPDVTVEIDHCIVGGVRVHERSNVSINNSIMDATDVTNVAFAAANGTDAGGTLQIANSTVIGTVHTLELQLASNCIFMSDVRSEKKQEGCVRFCYLPLTSVVPRRYRCQPDDNDNALRVRPQFTSLRYGDPGYGQLALRTAAEIREGADDEAEMGAFHELFQPQRETNLRVRLSEYLRFGLEAGIFYAT